MKIVVNECWGGFGVSDFAMKKLGIDCGYDADRTDKRLVALIGEFGCKKISGDFSVLVIKEIPDDATDWWIDEHNGYERAYYVKDGKRRFAG